MKVESSNDVRTIQHLDLPVVSPPATARTPVKGVDETTQLFNPEVEAHSRTLNQRALGVRVPPAEKLAQLYEQLGHPAQATLAATSRRIRLQLLQQPGVDRLLEMTGGDPARAFVVLKHVAARADAEVRKSEAALARAAITKLEVRFKSEIQAGLNIAAALQAVGVDPKERQALRTLYYASVVTRQSLATMMQALLGMYGGARFGVGLKLMRKALADDIAAMVSSMPTPMLRTLLQGLQSCGQLSGVLAGCQALTQRLCIEHDAVALLQGLLGYAGSGVGGGEVRRLGDGWGGGPLDRQLVSLNALYPLFQQLPLALWTDSRTRQETLQGFLVVMDELDRIHRGPTRFAGEPRPLA